MVKYMQMKFAAIVIFALCSAPALAAAWVVVPQLPASVRPLAEVETNVVFSSGMQGDNLWKLAIELDASLSNCVEIAFGADADNDGVLGMDEGEMCIGWDCGEWFWRDRRANTAAFFQNVLMRLALCGLAASLALLALRSRLARGTFARVLSAWRSLTAFGRVAACSFLLIGILIGGDKTNSVPPNMNLPLPQMVGGGIIQGGAASCRAGDLRNGSFTWRGGTPFLMDRTTFPALR